mmetsp:Transcript_64054/g.187422  ORF Transcript_64054/g.187422 Transcript_64054/m.187422 type:complete len:188 (-) Transcript_64054:245-808(-)
MERPVPSAASMNGCPAPGAAGAPDGALLLAMAGMSPASGGMASLESQGTGQQPPPHPGTLPGEDRNGLHKFAQDIRERGTLGAVVEAVKQNPLLLVPGGTAIMAAQAWLGSGDPSEDACAASGPGPHCVDEFDLSSVLAPAAAEVEVPAQQPQPPPGAAPARAEAPGQQQPRPAAPVETVDLLGLGG